MQEVEVLIGGKPVRQIAHEGKLFIVAREGQEYEIKLRNNSLSRVAGVVSVDGLNVVSGKPCQSKDASYVINGNGTYTVRGFRTSNQKVHPFKFNRKNKSYSKKSGNGDQNCGVIGVTFWSEKEKPPVITKTIIEKEYIPYYPVYPKPCHPWYPNRPYWYCTSDYNGSSVGYTSNASHAMQCSTSSSLAAQNSGVLRSCNLNQVSDASFDLGTEFSKESTTDIVRDTEFDFGYQLSQIQIYYASRSMLEKMGVPVDQAKAVAFPQAFTGFCTPPKDS